MQAGTLTAILGGSGPQTTTILNAIAERMTGTTITGNVEFSGPRGINHVKSAYVMQQDVLIPTLNV